MTICLKLIKIMETGFGVASLCKCLFLTAFFPHHQLGKRDRVYSHWVTGTLCVHWVSVILCTHWEAAACRKPDWLVSWSTRFCCFPSLILWPVWTRKDFKSPQWEVAVIWKCSVDHFVICVLFNYAQTLKLHSLSPILLLDELWDIHFNVWRLHTEKRQS